MQKKNYFTKLLLALFALLPMTVAAQESVKLAEWNMENSADIAVTWFKDGAPQIAPDEAIGDKANYLLTGWSEGRYWQALHRLSEQGAAHRECRRECHHRLYRCLKTQCVLRGTVPNHRLQEHLSGFCLCLRCQCRSIPGGSSLYRRRSHMV